MRKDNVPRTDIRVLYRTAEFTAFYNAQPLVVQSKFDYVFNVMQTVYVLPVKFVKRLVNSNLYELRISAMGNEYRTVMFAMDYENIMQATRIVILNGFLKKSTKDYAKQIEKANKILNNINLNIT